MADYPNARDCEHGRLRRSCEQCSDAFLIAALEARLAEVEAERDRAWRECSKAQDESSVWFNKRAAAEGRAAKERSGRLAAEARLAEVEQALRELLYCSHGGIAPQYAEWVAARTVLDKGEPTKAARHMAHYRNCGCLDHGAECCDPSCCPVLDKGVQP